jgi:ammonium transporter, Amt family
MVKLQFFKFNMIFNKLIKYVLLVSTCLFSHLALAQAAAPESVVAADALWMSLCAILVLLMTTPGLIMFYAGLVRRKNALFLATQVVACTAVVTLVWLALGYSIAFTTGNALLGDMSRAFGHELFNKNVFALAPTVPEAVYFLFQMSFAIIATALVIGATAERMKLSTTIGFSALWALLVYSPVAHWIWHPIGWLDAAGHMDWAGGAVVHITAGVSGLVAAIMLGARHGFPVEPMPPHNLMTTMLGACFLWIGWFGFNGGGALAIGTAATTQVLFVTFMAGCVGAISWITFESLVYNKSSSLGIVTGAVVGLVSITPAAGFVGLNAALVLPAVASVLCLLTLRTVKKVFHIDDSLDVFAVHGMGGLVGTLLTPMFAFEDATKAINGTLINAMGALSVIAYSAVATALILWILKPIMGWRVDELAEEVGLDLSQIGETLES